MSLGALIGGVIRGEFSLGGTNVFLFIFLHFTSLELAWKGDLAQHLLSLLPHLQADILVRLFVKLDRSFGPCLNVRVVTLL